MDKRRFPYRPKSRVSHGRLQSDKGVRGPYEREKMVKQEPIEGSSTSSGYLQYCKPRRSLSLEDDMKGHSFRPGGGSAKDYHNAKPLVRMIVVDLQPLSVIEGAGFRELMRAVNPGYSIPKGISSLRSELLQLYESAKREIRECLSSANDIVLTSEMWTRGTESYQTVGCHFINHNWELKSYVLETKDLTGRNTGDEIFKQLLIISEDWEIKEKVHGLVMNGSHVLPKGSGWTYFPCFAHTLDLVFKRALSPADEALLKNCLKIVRFLHYNSSATGKLKDSLPPYQLTLSGDVGWNAAFHMLEKISQQHDAINHMLPHSTEKIHKLLDEELSKINNIVSALRLFENAAKDMSQQKYVSVSCIIPLARLLKDKLGEQAQNGNQVAGRLAEMVTQRFKDVEYHHKLMASTTLDARFKDPVLTDFGSTDQTRRKRLIQEVLSLARKATCPAPVSPGDPPGGLWGDYDKESECEEELRRYTTKEKIPRDRNPLYWWRFQSEEFPNLQRAARRYLGIVSTCVPTRRAFSKAGEVFGLQRIRLEPANLNVMLFLHANCDFSQKA